MVNRILTWIGVTVLAWFLLSPMGGCGSTGDGVMMLHVQRLIERYASSHDGALPRSWKDLQEMAMREQIFVSDSVMVGLKQRFALLDSPVPWTDQHREILALHRVGFYERSLDGVVRGPGRYVILRDGTGTLSRPWMGEDTAVRVFAATGRDLPGPGAKPEVRPSVRRAWTMQWVGIVLYGCLCLWTVWPLIRAMSERWMLARWARTGVDPGAEPTKA